MNKEVKELIDRLKDSIENPIVLVPTYDGSDEEPIDNDKCLTPNECKTLLDYINQLETSNFKLQARSDRYKQKIIQLEKQLEHYKVKEIERINKDLLQSENDYLERCIKANTRGGSNE